MKADFIGFLLLIKIDKIAQNQYNIDT